MQGVKGQQFTEITKPAIIVGRNNIPVPPDEVELMAKIGCTDSEIADHFSIKDDTLRRNFADYLSKGRSELKQRLRKAQLKLALSGNATMLIWLGKNILGQQESPQGSTKGVLPWTEEDEDTAKLLEDIDENN